MAWIKDGDDTEVGILLLSPPPQHVESRPNEWNVGVDFGTANTTVFYREDDGDRIAHVELDVKPLGLFDHPERNRFNTEYFVPSKEEKPHLSSSLIPTVYKVFDSVQSSHKTWLGRAYSISNPDHRVEVGKYIYHNLKWANDQESKIVNKAFIDQLIDLIVARLARRVLIEIKWSYSVPSAFSLYQRETFDNVWVESLRRKGQRNKPICRTESLCSALYFKEVEGATPKKGAICLDVGGKTTDIAVWQDNRLVFQTSLKCASHDILLESLAKKPLAVARLSFLV